jgi:hypothetical protein
MWSGPRDDHTALLRSFGACHDTACKGQRAKRRTARIEHMSTEADSPTYETATPKEVADARQHARTKLAEATQRHDRAYWERLRARFGVTAEPV